MTANNGNDPYGREKDDLLGPTHVPRPELPPGWDRVEKPWPDDREKQEKGPPDEFEQDRNRDHDRR